MNHIQAFRGIYIPEGPFYFPGNTTIEKLNDSQQILEVKVLKLKGGEAMQRAHKEWMTMKGWLFSPWLVIWGEEMVEGLLFQPHGIWDVEGAGE